MRWVPTILLGVLASEVHDLAGTPIAGTLAAYALATIGYLPLFAARDAPTTCGKRAPWLERVATTLVAATTSILLLAFIATEAPTAPHVILALVCGGVTAFLLVREDCSEGG